MVAIGSAPILAGLLARLVRGERPSLRWLGATGLAVSGCGMLIAAAWQCQRGYRGSYFSFGGRDAYAVFATASKDLLAARPANAVMAVVFCLGALFLSPLLIGADLRWLAQPLGAVVALHLGLIATAAAYILFGRGLTAVPVATAVTLSLAEPLTAGLLGLAVLGERLTLLAWLGIGLLFAGLAVLSVGRR
ncbi:MAG: EamA family transporter [Anaerolineae bacterium]